MAAELQGYEARRSHRADEVRRVLEDRGQPRDAALGQVLVDDVRGLQAVLVARELIVGDLDEGRISQRRRVLAVVVVAPALERERTGDQVARLVAAARGELDLKRPGGYAGGGERRASVIGRPLEVRDLRADGHFDRGRLHTAIEVELQRGPGIDLHAVSKLARRP